MSNMRPHLLLFFLMSIGLGIANDNSTLKDTLPTHIESEKWVKSHIVKGITRSDVLKLVGRPTFEGTGSTGIWLMSYFLKDPPYPSEQNYAYAGFEVSLLNERVVKINMIHRSITPSK